MIAVPVLARQQLAATLQAPGQARAVVRRALAAAGLGAVADDAALAVSELVANAVQHAAGPVGLLVRADGGRVLCEVSDGSRALPVARRRGERGRGLVIVAGLAAECGVRAGLRGRRKTCWFTLAGGA